MGVGLKAHAYKFLSFFYYMILKGYRLGHLKKGPIVKFIKALALFEIDEEMQLMIVGCLWHNYKPRKVIPFIASFQQKICDWIWVALYGRKSNM